MFHRCTFRGLMAAAVVTFLTTASSRSAWQDTLEAWEDATVDAFYVASEFADDAWSQRPTELRDHLRIGLRSPLYFMLHDGKRSVTDSNGDGVIQDTEVLRVSFLGSIDELEEKQSRFPRLYVQWEFEEFWGVEATWGHYRAKTITFWDGHTDGTFDLAGPEISVYGRYPNPTIFTPTAGLTLAYYGLDFVHNPAWRFNSGIQQVFSPDPTIGTGIFVGCDVELDPIWTLDVSYRIMWAEFDNSYQIRTSDGRYVIDDRGTTTFPFDSSVLAVGVKCLF